MTTFTPPTESPDADLVARSLQGDRTAYAAIVQRYQSLICSLTYSACGDRHQSEDLAQETFLAAWKSLPELTDPAHLRPWLRGIARNLTHNAIRKHRRTPSPDDPAAADLLADPTPTPPDAAITREEQTLLWQNLSRLPDDYREPLVLFYRHQQSVAAVASALDLSEDAARQRLSRGRAMLARRLEHLIDRGLRASAPGPAFTLAVTTSLPAVTASHTAATLATTTKATAFTKVASIATSILSPFVSFAAVYVGYRINLDQAIAPEERHHVRRAYRFSLLIGLGFSVAIAAIALTCIALGVTPATIAGLLAVLVTLFVAVIIAAAFRHAALSRRLRADLTAARPGLAAEAEHAARIWNLQYRSPWTLLGLPLLHVNFGSTPDLRSRVATGWIAIGTAAYSPLFAIGVFAAAPLAWGACSVGLLAYGGLALGPWSVGGLAIGYDAAGAFALAAHAAHAAQGVVALAPTYADGLAASATHVNDPAAEAFFQSAPFFRTWTAIAAHDTWLYLLPLVPVLLMLRRARRLRQRPPA